jgi:hypothetical protein
MKSKLLFIALGAVALATASCSDDEFGSSSSRTADAILTATVEGQTPNTRVGFGKPDNGVASFYWSNGDKVGVTLGGDSESAGFYMLTLTSGAGSGDASFTGTLLGELGAHAVYPYNTNHKYADGTLTYYFPSSYDYDKLDTDFYPESGTAEGKYNSYNAAMFAEIDGTSAKFKHLGGVFCVQVQNPGASGKLVFTTNKKINGTFTTTVGNTTPTLDAADTYAEGENTVTIKYTNADADQATGTFYIPVPVGKYNVEISLYDGNNTLKESFSKSDIDIDRAYLYGIRLPEVSTAAELRTALAGTAKTIYVAGDIDISESQISISRDVTINIDPNVTVKSALQTEGGNILVKNGGSLTLSGSGVLTGDHRVIEVEDGGTLNIEGVTINATKEAADKTVACTAVYMYSGAKVNLKSGLITANNTGIYNGEGTVDITGGKIDAVMIGVQNIGGALTMSGGEIDQNTHGSTAYCGVYIKGGSYTCTGGKVDAQESAVFADTYAASIDISGGSFYGNCVTSTGHYVYTINLAESAASTSTLNISGDTYVQGTYGCVNIKAGTATISGGTFVAVDSKNSYYALYATYKSQKVTITGGNFYATNREYDMYLYETTSEELDIDVVGGNFKNGKFLLTVCSGTGASDCDKSYSCRFTNWAENVQTIDGLTYNYTAYPYPDDEEEEEEDDDD